jgi:hypothetical protein
VDVVAIQKCNISPRPVAVSVSTPSPARVRILGGEKTGKNIKTPEGFYLTLNGDCNFNSEYELLKHIFQGKTVKMDTISVIFTIHLYSCFPIFRIEEL